MKKFEEVSSGIGEIAEKLSVDGKGFIMMLADIEGTGCFIAGGDLRLLVKAIAKYQNQIILFEGFARGVIECIINNKNAAKLFRNILQTAIVETENKDANLKEIDNLLNNILAKGD